MGGTELKKTWKEAGRKQRKRKGTRCGGDCPSLILVQRESCRLWRHSHYWSLRSSTDSLLLLFFAQWNIKQLKSKKKKRKTNGWREDCCVAFETKSFPDRGQVVFCIKSVDDLKSEKRTAEDGWSDTKIANMSQIRFKFSGRLHSGAVALQKEIPKFNLNLKEPSFFIQICWSRDASESHWIVPVLLYEVPHPSVLSGLAALKNPHTMRMPPSLFVVTFVATSSAQCFPNLLSDGQNSYILVPSGEPFCSSVSLSHADVWRTRTTADVCGLFKWLYVFKWQSQCFFFVFFFRAGRFHFLMMNLAKISVISCELRTILFPTPDWYFSVIFFLLGAGSWSLFVWFFFALMLKLQQEYWWSLF